MTPCSNIVQRVKHNVEGLEPRNVKLWVHNVRKIGLELCVGPELLRNFFGNLKYTIQVSVFDIICRQPFHVMRTRGAEHRRIRKEAAQV